MDVEEARKKIEVFYKRISDVVKFCLKNLRGEYLAMSLTNASCIYALARDIKSLNECVDRIKDIKYQDDYERTLAHAAGGYAEVDRVDEILRELEKSNYYVGAIYNVISAHARNKRFEKVESYLKILEDRFRGTS